MSEPPRREKAAPIREAEAPVSGPVAQGCPLGRVETDADRIAAGRWLDVAQRWLLPGGLGGER